MSCPICGRGSDPRYRPFCTRRCADVDLGRWLTGAYTIPVEEAEDDEADGGEGRADAGGDLPESVRRPLDKGRTPV